MRLPIFLAMLLAFALGTTGAFAQSWQASVRPDNKNGGDRIILVGELGGGKALFFQCDGLRQPTLAFISKDMDTFPSMPTDRDVKLAFDIDGFASGGIGTYYEHGEGYLGLQIADRAVVAKVVGDLAKAKFGIKLTITNPKYASKMQFPVGLSGANASAKQFSDYCFKGAQLPAQNAEAAPQPESRPSTWRVYQAVGGSLVLSVETDPKEGTLFFACQDKQLTLIYLSSKPRDLPFNRTARSVALTFTVDGFTYGGEAGYYEDDRGAGIAFGQQGTINDIISTIAVAQDEIKMSLLGIQGAPYERTFAIPGAAENGRAFLDNCR